MKYLFLGVILVAILDGCNSSNNISGQGNGQNDAIEISISNFSKIGRLYKPDNVFSIWVNNLRTDEDVKVVSIIRFGGKLLLTKEAKVGSKGKLPSRYIEKNGKLFFWWDDDFALTEEALAVFRKYDILQDDKNGLIKIPYSKMDDTQKGVDYYFCKKNLINYKRVVTNIGLGYYTPPELNCNNK